ncbi:unnamed protein product, partial [Ectocarpus sp. 6 AP-2014]
SRFLCPPPTYTFLLLLLLCHSCATTAAALGARHGVPHLACLGLYPRERGALDW